MNDGDEQNAPIDSYEKRLKIRSVFMPFSEEASPAQGGADERAGRVAG